MGYGEERTGGRVLSSGFSRTAGQTGVQRLSRLVELETLDHQMPCALVDLYFFQIQSCTRTESYRRNHLFSNPKIFRSFCYTLLRRDIPSALETVVRAVDQLDIEDRKVYREAFVDVAGQYWKERLEAIQKREKKYPLDFQQDFKNAAAYLQLCLKTLPKSIVAAVDQANGGEVRLLRRELRDRCRLLLTQTAQKAVPTLEGLAPA